MCIPKADAVVWEWETVGDNIVGFRLGRDCFEAWSGEDVLEVTFEAGIGMMGSGVLGWGEYEPRV